MSAMSELEEIRKLRVRLLVNLLEENDRNPSWLAKQLGTTRAGAHRYVQGANIPEEKLAKICDLFDKPLSFLHNPIRAASDEIDWDVVSEVVSRVDEAGARSDVEKKSMYALLYVTLMELNK